MKKLLFSALIMAGGSFTSNAQLADGSIAPDFTVSAYQSWLSTAGMNNDGTFNLYDYLDAGYTVILDVSATWCGPCWNHHLTGALDDLYVNHGPAGELGVSASTTDDVMVMWMDGDGTTADATMLDGAGSIGNWIEPNATLGQIPFPMCNPASTIANQINNDYNIGYFPTIYRICPNRIITEVGQLNAAQFYTAVGVCPDPASQPSDVAAIAYKGVKDICPGSYSPKVQIQNNGTTNLTDATITITQGGNTVSTGTYSGSLATYGVATVTCSSIASFNGGTLTVNVTTTGDANASNGTLTQMITVDNSPVGTATNNVIVEITTDRYGSETTWDIISAATGATIASGGPWSNLSANGQTVRTPVNVTNLVAGECYLFTINDDYGDGMCCDFGNGAFSVKDGNNNIVISGATFTYSESQMFKIGALGLVEAVDFKNFNVYPNPATDVLNVVFDADNADYVIAITDLQGREVNASSYAGLSGAQSIKIPVANLAKGSYVVTISSNGATSTKNIIVE